MNRRGFLAMLTAAALDPERALWVPGKKLISIPRPRLMSIRDQYRQGIMPKLSFNPWSILLCSNSPTRWVHSDQQEQNRLLSLQAEVIIHAPGLTMIRS